MKLTWKGDHNATLTADNPDESIRRMFIGKIAESVQSELHDFLEEVSVTMRKLEPGQTATVTSMPITVTLEKPAKEQPS